MCTCRSCVGLRVRLRARSARVLERVARCCGARGVAACGGMRAGYARASVARQPDGRLLQQTHRCVRCCRVCRIRPPSRLLRRRLTLRCAAQLLEVLPYRRMDAQRRRELLAHGEADAPGFRAYAEAENGRDCARTALARLR